MAAPYFAVVPGRINVTAAGSKVLQGLGGRPTNTWYASSLKPGSTIRAKLQLEVTALQSKCKFPGVTATNHHIYAGSRITTILSGALKQHTNSIDLVNNYINSRTGIQNYLMDLVKSKEENQAITDVYASVFWNEYNLVLGPTDRNGEPGSQTDYEVLGLQTDAVKKDYKNIDAAYKINDFYEALRILLQKRAMFNGNWTKATNGKWNLFPPQISPGTTGFAYDIWPWY